MEHIPAWLSAFVRLLYLPIRWIADFFARPTTGTVKVRRSFKLRVGSCLEWTATKTEERQWDDRPTP